MVLLIDNYDSFTYNLYQALAVLGPEVKVVRHDDVTCEEVLVWKPSHIVISPGPKTPRDSGICLELVGRVAETVPILGVCLGHQILALAFGGNFCPAKRILHGKTSRIFHRGEDIFEGLPSPFTATRYHSLAVEEGSLPESLEITARAEDGEIMALRHRKYPCWGVQFHPESILTREGPALLKNFLST